MATAEFKPTSSPSQLHWMIELERLLGSFNFLFIFIFLIVFVFILSGYCGSCVASALITGFPYNVALERPYLNILEDDLLQGHFRKEVYYYFYTYF